MEMRSALFKIFFLVIYALPIFYCHQSLSANEQDSSSDNSLVKMLKDPQFQAFLESEYGTSFVNKKHPPSTNNLDLLRRCFNKDYLEKYYPKVFVIRERFFSDMSIDHMLVILKEIVEVFAENPWIYFANEKDNFVVIRYWEYIVDQLSFINEFLRKAYFDTSSKKIIAPKHIDSFSSKMIGGQYPQQNIRPLFIVFDEKQKRVVSEFYALCFDYLIKLFNEGILLKDPKISDRFLCDLDFVMEKLHGSEFEPDYQEVLKTCKELRKILDYKCGIDDYDGLDDDEMMSSR